MSADRSSPFRPPPSGIPLLIAAAVAIVWANSPWRSLYERILSAPVGMRIGGLSFERDLHFWINDGLMVVFFFAVALEIKHELRSGELGTIRRAALPALAALGGMAVPAAIYFLLNAHAPAARGWGIPMATDIAFAVSALTLLGQRVTPALRITLLALAVIDDLGAILVIALFYSSGIGLTGLAVAALGVGLILGMRKAGFRSPWAYVPAALLIWAGACAGGVHPTLAGVAVGLLTPAGGAAEEPEGDDAREGQAPAEWLQRALERWVAFGIMPIFALANAGVSLGQIHFGGEPKRVFLGVVLGLLLGKPIGVLGFSWLAVRLRAARLPDGVAWPGMLVLGLLAGTGFTMSLFMSGLALPPGPLTEMAKAGILAASALAVLIGLLAGRLWLRQPDSSP